MLAPTSAMLVGLVVVKVPPHWLLVLVATVSPVGSVSLNATPFSITALAAGFMMVNCNCVVAFNEIGLARNTLAIEGGATTSMLAENDPPVPPSLDVTLPVMLFLVPAVVPVTFTTIVQEVDAARLPPVRLMLLLPATAVAVPPQPLLLSPLGVETTSPAGSVSLKAMPVRVVLAFTLARVMVSIVVPFSGIEAAVNALLMLGGTTTVIDAFDVLPTPPSVDVTVTLLFFTPAEVPLTSTVNVQEALAARVPPDRVMLLLPAVAVIVQLPQDPAPLAWSTTTRPQANRSQLP